MTKLALVGLLLAQLAPPLPEPRPNFSGRWVQVSPPKDAGTERVVEQTETTLTTGQGAKGDGHRFTYRLDGTEMTERAFLRAGTIVTVHTASWDGSRLTITSYTDDGKQMWVWSMNDKGQLVIDLTQTVTGRVPTQHQIIYRKG